MLMQSKVWCNFGGGMELGPRCACLAKLDAASWLPTATQLRKQTPQPEPYTPKWCACYIWRAPIIVLTSFQSAQNSAGIQTLLDVRTAGRHDLRPAHKPSRPSEMRRRLSSKVRGGQLSLSTNDLTSIQQENVHEPRLHPAAARI